MDLLVRLKVSSVKRLIAKIVKRRIILPKTARTHVKSVGVLIMSTFNALSIKVADLFLHTLKVVQINRTANPNPC